MNTHAILRSAFFGVILLSEMLQSETGLSQSFDFKSIKNVGPPEAAQSNVVIDRIGPAGIVKRLRGRAATKLTVPAVKQWLLDGGVSATAFAQ
jgi:hypothetical protein